MDVYIVIGELDGYISSSDKETVDLYTTEERATTHSIDLASGNISIGGTARSGNSRPYKLKKIIRFNTNNHKATELELVLEDGSFTLKTINQKQTNKNLLEEF